MTDAKGSIGSASEYASPLRSFPSNAFFRLDQAPITGENLDFPLRHFQPLRPLFNSLNMTISTPRMTFKEIKMADEQIVTLQAAAEIAGGVPATILNWCHDYKIGTQGEGGVWTIDPAALQR